MPIRRIFRVVRGSDGLRSIQREWSVLVKNISHPRFFHMYAWYQAYVENIEPSPECAIFVFVRQDDELEAIFPLYEARKRYFGLAVRVLRTLRHPHFNLHDILLNSRLDHRSLISDLFRYLNEHGGRPCDVLQFDRVLDDSASMQLTGRGAFKTTVIAEGFCDYVAVRSSKDFLSGVSRNFRRNLKRAKKKLAEHTAVEFLSTRDPGNLRQYYQEFLEVEASGWKRASGTRTAIMLHPSLIAFYGQLLERFGEDGQCEINLLRVDGATIAGQFALVIDDTFYALKIGYDEKHAGVAPGNTLLVHIIDRLNREGSIRYVNLVTDAAWHERWRPLGMTFHAAVVTAPGSSQC